MCNAHLRSQQSLLNGHSALPADPGPLEVRPRRRCGRPSEALSGPLGPAGSGLPLFSSASPLTWAAL